MAADRHDDERERYEEFSRKGGLPQYRSRLDSLYADFARFNAEYFFGQLKRPHVAIGVTPSRRAWVFRTATGNGGLAQYLFHERLMFPAELDRKKAWVLDATSKGYRDLVADGLLQMMTQHYVYEVEGVSEQGYRWFGPRFEHHANRVGAYLEVAQVAHRRPPTDDETNRTPLAPCWPAGVRPEGHYGQAFTPAFLDLVCGRKGERAASLAVPPGLGMLDYFLFLIALGKVKRLGQILKRQADWVERLRTKFFPSSKSVEAGMQDPDGAPIPEGYVPSFDPAWLTRNNGIGAKMLEGIDACRTYQDMPVLADALEDAGCGDMHVLRHLRAEMEHCGGSCWVLKGLLALAKQND